MDLKRCCKCGIEKPRTREYFGINTRSKDGFKFSCKLCRKFEYESKKEIVKLKRKEHYIANRESILISTKKYRVDHIEWYQNNNKKYYEAHKAKMIENSKRSLYRRIATDPGFKAQQRLRKRLWQATFVNGKAARTKELIGCSTNELREHLEKQFRDGMTWENYGKWHIDHIRPCASFDLSIKEQQLECFNYTNLQPLWAIENYRKSDKYESEV